jgi:small subunit ribosomal protein S18
MSRGHSELGLFFADLGDLRVEKSPNGSGTHGRPHPDPSLLPRRITIDTPPAPGLSFPLFQEMSATETTATQSLTPEAFPFTQPELMVRYVTDTGKILPRKYTHLSAKQQRRVTKTIKRSRAMLLAK